MNFKVFAQKAFHTIQLIVLNLRIIRMNNAK